MHDEPDITINFDVECNSCRYNLRGLSPHGSCPECGSSIEPSLESHEKDKRSRFRRVTFRHRRALLSLHLAVGVFYLVGFIVPQVTRGGPWRFVRNMKSAEAIVMLLIFLGPPLATALMVTVVKMTKANRDRLTKRQYRFLMVAAYVGYAPTAVVIVLWVNFLLWFSI